ncbi:MAG: hypothetical protein Q8N96_09555 [Methylovulum sp.]|nr:hypothetical protein [Methylovulum sp.]
MKKIVNFILSALFVIVSFNVYATDVEQNNHVIYAFELLSVQDDGTLAIYPDALEKIPEDERQIALDDLDRLNGDILSGKEPRYKKNDKRLTASADFSKIADYKRSRGSCQSSSDKTRSAKASACFCADGCCNKFFKTCCKSGWWLYCSKLVQCKPKK